MKSILFIYYHDSYKIIVELLAKICVAAEDKINILDYRKIDNLSALEIHSYDTIFIGLGGRKLYYFIKKLRDNYSDLPILSVAFPGVTYNMQERGFIARVNADNILFNSIKNHQDYCAFCNDYDTSPSNGVVTGFPQLIGAQSKGYNFPPKRIIYVDQNIVPASKRLRLLMLRKLISYAELYPDREILIISAKQNNAHICLYPLDDNNLKSPPNISYIRGNAAAYLADTDLCIGFSSSILIESIARKIPTVSISDFGLRKIYGNQLFEKSGIFQPFSKILSDNYNEIEVDPYWKKINISLPVDEQIYAALHRSNKQTQTNLNPDNINVDYPRPIKEKLFYFLYRSPSLINQLLIKIFFSNR